MTRKVLLTLAVIVGALVISGGSAALLIRVPAPPTEFLKWLLMMPVLILCATIIMPYPIALIAIWKIWSRHDK